MWEDKDKFSLGEADFIRLLASAGVMLSHPNISAQPAALPDENIKLEDLLIDSFTFIEIAIQLEDQYGVSLSPDKLQESKTLRGLFDLVGKSIHARN